MDEDDDRQGGGHMDYRYPPQQRGDGWEEWRGGAYPMTDTNKYPPEPIPHQYPQQQQYPEQYSQQKSPYFSQKFDHSGVPRDPMLVPMNEPLDPLHERSRSALPPVQSSVFEDFRDVPRQEHRRSHRHRSSCRRCDPHKHRHRRRRSHGGHHHHKSYYSSDACSTEEGTESRTGSRLHHHHHHRHRSCCHRHGPATSPRRQQNNSDNESDLISDSTTADPNYQGTTRKRHKSVGDKKGPRQVKREAKERQTKSASNQAAGDEQEVPNKPAASYQQPVTTGGITIPQHIVIPPALDSSAERKYHINSEITISYDPRLQAGGLLSPAHQPGSPASSTHRRPATGMGSQAPMSITSNV